MGIFKKYLSLQEKTNKELQLEYFDLKKLDQDFIKDATKLTSFNVLTKHFESLKYKKEIQHLFNVHFFPDFDLNKTLKNIDKDKLNKLIAELKQQNSAMFDRLHQYNAKGIGPGEITIYFLVNNAHLGGGSSAGVDVIDIGGKKYETKAVNYSAGGANNESKPHVFHFKMGGTMDFSSLIAELLDLKTKSGGKSKGKEIATSDMKKIKDNFPKEYERIENKYAEIAYKNYWRHHEVIFIRNKGKKIGDIIDITKVKQNQIKMQTYSSNSLKPIILI